VATSTGYSWWWVPADTVSYGGIKRGSTVPDPRKQFLGGGMLWCPCGGWLRQRHLAPPCGSTDGSSFVDTQHCPWLGRCCKWSSGAFKAAPEQQPVVNDEEPGPAAALHRSPYAVLSTAGSCPSQNCAQGVPPHLVHHSLPQIYRLCCVWRPTPTSSLDHRLDSEPVAARNYAGDCFSSGSSLLILENKSPC
jgi:hypothetical protein